MIRMTPIGAKQISAKLSNLGRKELRRILVGGVESGARIVERDVKGRRFTGDPIHVRSGFTRASIRTAIDRSTPQATVGTPVKHVIPLEFGATIRAKNSRLLTIPLRAARTASGKSRGDARSVGARYERTYWAKSAKGTPILWGERGGKRVALFVGKTRVVIPARHAFKKATDATRVGVVRTFETGIARAVK